MFVRSAASTALVCALALVFGSVATAAPKPPGSSPKAPSNLRVTAVGEKSVSLAWDAGAGNSSNWWYCVQSSGAGCFRVDPPKTTFTHPSLTPGATYTFSVVIVSSNGQRSGPSNSVTVTIPPDTTPPTAPVLSVTSVVPVRISLSWTTSTDNTGQVSQTLYIDGVAYFGPVFGFNGMLIPYLEPGSTHSYQVIARDRFGNSSASNTVTQTQPPVNDATPPAAPSNLMFSSETSPPEIWLDWTAASDNLDPAGQLLYEVFVNGTRASVGLGNVEDIVYCVDTGLNTIKVRVLDTSGNAGPFSNEISLVC
jgi:Fibronectin type III domain